MDHNRQAIIFARAPRLGRGKRRLAQDIGNFRAYQFYRQNLKKLITDLRTGRWNLHIAVATAQDAKHPMFAGLSILVQPHGDLGCRMRSVLQQFKQSQVVIVGSDIHGVSRTHLNRAFTLLNTHDVVFGPAFDGGFWLVGSGRTRTPGSRFMRGVRWSTQYALEDTLATVSSGRRVGQVLQLHDIDDGASYKKFYAKPYLKEEVF